MNTYPRYFLTWLLLLVTTWGFILGGGWMWMGLAFNAIVVMGGDFILKDDLSVPSYRHPWLLDLQLYGAIPLLLAMLAVLAWMCGAEGDWLGLGALVQSLSGWDMQAARARTAALDLVGGVISAGLMTVTAGTNVSHELVHRMRNKYAVVIGRWLLALTCDTSFSIEHLHGHHLYVGTTKDPATARRGESVYRFMVRSVIGQSRSAWHIEKRRLQRQGIAFWSRRNRMLRGIAMSAGILVIFYLAGGATGLLVFFATTLWGRALLEQVNYIQHYGLLRQPGTRVQSHHSWSCHKPVSTAVLYNLTRHAHHHAAPQLPFWRLRSDAQAPHLDHGYLTLILITMIPPLWHRLMIPKLQEWDRVYASAQERRLAAAANAASGLPALTPIFVS